MNATLRDPTLCEPRPSAPDPSLRDATVEQAKTAADVSRDPSADDADDATEYDDGYGYYAAAATAPSIGSRGR